VERQSGPSLPLGEVLIVDGDEAVLASLRSLLRRRGWECHTFAKANDALEFLKSHSVPIVVSEVRLPGRSGVEFLNDVASVCPQATRIMTAAYDDKRVLLGALSKGLIQHYVFKPWDDLVFRDLLDRIVEEQQEMGRLELKEILSELSSLPAPVRYHDRLKGLLAGEEASIQEVVREVEQSPPLTAKILRVANSVHVSATRHITTIKDAVVLIGTQYVLGFITGQEAFDSLRRGDDAQVTHNLEGLWEFSVRRAGLARRICESGRREAHGASAYVASLLQDIGLGIRLSFQPERYREMRQLQQQSSLSLLEADAQVFRTTHEKVGGAVLRQWNFPEEISRAVVLSHGLTGADPVAEVVQLSDVLAGGEEPGSHDPKVIAESLEYAELGSGESPGHG
jgi:HD-like signal output (HDOD) protein/CheY-like chemotaxis protein